MNNYNYNSSYNLKENSNFDSNYGMDGYTVYSNEVHEYPEYGGDLEGNETMVTEIYQIKSRLVEEVVAKSFLFMGFALLITAIAAFATPVETAMFVTTGNNYYIFVVAEVGIIWLSNFAINRNKPVLAGVLYLVYSYLNGVILSIVFREYATLSIVAITVATAAFFGIMAAYGLLTKRDLSRIGNVCVMGIVGIAVSGLLNIFFLHSTVADTVICAVGVLFFVGMIAYDTQIIKERVYEATDETVLVLALYGGFELYLIFINLFLRLLRLIGKKS